MKIIKGDLINLFEKGRFEYIGHQCNMVSISNMCGGIARKIFHEYPNTARAQDWVVHNRGNLDFTGGLYVFDTYEKVINIYGQYYPGGGSTEKTDIDFYERRRDIMASIFKIMNKELSGKSIGLPLIASGLAKGYDGLNISDFKYFETFIQPIIGTYLTDLDVTIIKYHG